jgi:aquaglyceroporin related protein
MVSPFFGCLFGGWLYDTFLFTGESPINTPWMGLEYVFRPMLTKWSWKGGQIHEVQRKSGDDQA